MITTFKCPECDAALEVQSGVSIVRCKFCGASVDVRATAARAAVSTQHIQNSRTSGGGPNVAPAIVTILMLVLVFVGGVVFYVIRGGSRGGGKHGHASPSSASSFMWYPASSSPPWAGLVNDDGVEDVIGLIATRGSGTPVLSLAAFDGSNFKQLWDIPLGNPQGSSYVRFNVSGQRLVATDAKQTTRIYELSTGKELGKVALPDQADGLCVQQMPPQAWVLAADKTGVLIDVATMHGEPAKQPAWCSLAPRDIYNVFSVFARHTDATAHRSANDDVFASPHKKSIPGFRSDFTLSKDGMVVAVGSKSPGTPLPMMVGLSATGAPTWSRQLSADSLIADGGASDCGALGHGLVVGAFPQKSSAAGGDLHVVALDAQSGSPRWEANLVGAGRYIRPDWMVITGTRTYVSIGTTLSVFDAKSGAAVGTIGSF